MKKNSWATFLGDERQNDRTKERQNEGTTRMVLHHTCIYTYMDTYIYTYIHTYIHIPSLREGEEVPEEVLCNALYTLYTV